MAVQRGLCRCVFALRHHGGQSLRGLGEYALCVERALAEPGNVGQGRSVVGVASLPGDQLAISCLAKLLPGDLAALKEIV